MVIQWSEMHICIYNLNISLADPEGGGMGSGSPPEKSQNIEGF